jgi:thiosulfate/3-mercaptopyruvate sulfurtransferase
MSLRSYLIPVLAVLSLSASDPDPWKAADALRPAELAAQLHAGAQPTILMVGPHALYRIAHIHGAVFAGQTNSPEGIAHLIQAAANLSKDAHIVIYCGCCPMQMCPNIRPAYKALHDAGYRDVKVLIIPSNLKTDWTDRGFPIEKTPA